MIHFTRNTQKLETSVAREACQAPNNSHKIRQSIMGVTSGQKTRCLVN